MRVTAAPFVCAGLVAYGAVLAAACDSDKFYPSTGSRGFPPTPLPVDAGTRRPAEVPPSPCEEAEPTHACVYGNPAACELGDAANVRCNEVLTCTGSQWRRADAGTPCVSACPSTFTLGEPDAACGLEHASTVLCEYPEGLCGCMHSASTGDAGDAGDPDAASVDGGTYVWTCIEPKRQEGCPRTRPRLGDRCVRKVTCDYGSCVFDDGILVECRGGTDAFWSRSTAKPECQQPQP